MNLFHLQSETGQWQTGKNSWLQGKELCSTLIQTTMQRRDFMLTSILALPAFAVSAHLERFIGADSKAFVLYKGQSRFGVPTPFKGVNPNDLKLSTRDTAGKLSAFWYRGVEKTGPSYHAHPFQDEVFYVLEGNYVFQLGEEKQLLNKGDLIFLPRTIPHTWVQVSDVGQLFYFLQPAGKMEEFFLKMTESGGKMSREESRQVGESHGIINHGPGISAGDVHVFAEKLSHGFVIRAAQSRYNEKTILGGTSPNDLKVSGKDTGGELSIFEYNGRSKGGPPMHIHPHQDEIFYISSGQYRFQCGAEIFDLMAGDMIFYRERFPIPGLNKAMRGSSYFSFSLPVKWKIFLIPWAKEVYLMAMMFLKTTTWR
ncbi:MAG: cupin domain-containing protein [Saprospiraceae bacterium]|nr:cupin domain-containing protein [Saprospiraceae bacterium]